MLVVGHSRRHLGVFLRHRRERCPNYRYQYQRREVLSHIGSFAAVSRDLKGGYSLESTPRSSGSAPGLRRLESHRWHRCCWDLVARQFGLERRTPNPLLTALAAGP
jgi:hypothetical protein